MIAMKEINEMQHKAMQWLDHQDITKNIIPDKIHSGKVFKFIAQALPQDMQYEFIHDGFVLRTC